MGSGAEAEADARRAAGRRVLVAVSAVDVDVVSVFVLADALFVGGTTAVRCLLREACIAAISVLSIADERRRTARVTVISRSYCWMITGPICLGTSG